MKVRRGRLRAILDEGYVSPTGDGIAYLTTAIDDIEAIAEHFEWNSEDRIEDAVMLLRKVLLAARKARSEHKRPRPSVA